MQAHQQPVRLLGQGVVGRQPLGEDQRAGDVSTRFLVRDGGRERIAAQRPDPLARAAHPVIELVAVLVAEGAEQLAGGGGRIVRQPRRQRRQVVLDAVGQREGRVFDDHIAASAMPQPEQPLAEVVAGFLRVGIGPQQRGRAGPRQWAVDGQQGEQRRVLALQRHQGAARQHEGGDGQQAQARHGGKRRSGHVHLLGGEPAGPRPQGRGRARSRRARPTLHRRSHGVHRSGTGVTGTL